MITHPGCQQILATPLFTWLRCLQDKRDTLPGVICYRVWNLYLHMVDWQSVYTTIYIHTHKYPHTQADTIVNTHTRQRLSATDTQFRAWLCSNTALHYDVQGTGLTEARLASSCKACLIRWRQHVAPKRRRQRKTQHGVKSNSTVPFLYPVDGRPDVSQ
jgi:hypothetical protein